MHYQIKPVMPGMKAAGTAAYDQFSAGQDGESKPILW